MIYSTSNFPSTCNPLAQPVYYYNRSGASSTPATILTMCGLCLCLPEVSTSTRFFSSSAAICLVRGFSVFCRFDTLPKYCRMRFLFLFPQRIYFSDHFRWYTEKILDASNVIIALELFSHAQLYYCSFSQSTMLRN